MTSLSSRFLLSRSLGLAAFMALGAPQGAMADGPSAAPPMPETLGGQRVVEVAAGHAHSCAVTEGGDVWCWGWNGYGQLGDGTTTDRLTPVRVQGLTGATQVVAGVYHSCALRGHGRVFCWGDNASGQLGDGTNDGRSVPVRVAGLTGVTQLSGGAAHNCALRTNRRVVCWGANFAGQLGDGTTTSRTAPVQVLGRLATAVTAVSAGGQHSCLLRGTGRVACWGNNADGQLGDGTTTGRTAPVLVPGLTNATRIDTGFAFSCGLRGSGRLYCWGANGSGQLGDGTTTGRPTAGRVLGRMTDVTTMALGDGFACAYRAGGQAYCWGANADGQLGDGTTTQRLTPVRVVGGLITNGQRIAAGAAHVCAVGADGGALCWGRNSRGQIGDGSTDDRLVPVIVSD